MTTTLERLSKARSVLVMTQPFYGTLALRLRLEEVTHIPTLATDGARIIYNPAYIDPLTDVEIRGCIAHEVMHVANKHMTRRGERDPEKFNIACDAVINPEIIAAGFTLPKGAIFIKEVEGMNAEEAYRWLQDNPDKCPKGTGAGGDIMDACGAHEHAKRAEIEAEIDIAIRQAISVANKQKPGSVPGSVAEQYRALHTQPRNWRAILRDFIDMRSADYSFTRPNKRLLNLGIIMPGLVPDKLTHLVYLIDCSGSMDTQAVQAGVDVAQDVLDSGVVQRISMVFIDTDVRVTHEFQAGDKVTVDSIGGGGTRFSPGMDWIRDHAPDASAAVYFTDLECGDWGEEPPVPLMWAVYGYRARDAKVPFGEVLAINRD